MVRMKKLSVNHGKFRRGMSRLASKAKRFVASTALIGSLMLPNLGYTQEKAEKPVELPRVTAVVKSGAGVDLLSRDPRATVELNLSTRMPLGLKLNTNFGLSAVNLVDQPGVGLEQMDFELSSPNFGPVVLTAYIQSSRHLATNLALGGNAFIGFMDFGVPLFTIIGAQKNLEGPALSYLAIGIPIQNILTLTVGGVTVLNDPVAGARVGLSITPEGFPEIYLDSFTLVGHGDPIKGQVLFSDITAGIRVPLVK